MYIISDTKDDDLIVAEFDLRKEIAEYFNTTINYVGTAVSRKHKIKGRYLIEKIVEGDLYQDEQEVKGNLNQSEQKVKGNFITQRLKEDEEYKINKYGYNTIIKKVKTHTLQELKEILGYDFKII